MPKVIKYVKRSIYSFHDFSAKHTPSATLNGVRLNRDLQKLTNPSILAYVDFSKPFVLNVDASLDLVSRTGRTLVYDCLRKQGVMNI